MSSVLLNNSSEAEDEQLVLLAQDQVDELRQDGHVSLSPDYPEYKTPFYQYRKVNFPFEVGNYVHSEAVPKHSPASRGGVARQGKQHSARRKIIKNTRPIKANKLKTTTYAQAILHAGSEYTHVSFACAGGVKNNISQLTSQCYQYAFEQNTPVNLKRRKKRKENNNRPATGNIRNHLFPHCDVKLQYV